ncbi:hypothetical protein [Yersinia rohdei]|uniref:hypothetical protein n=1 Tax=Yersinia rohdei TaxID=29485 RepID=UPI0001A5547B|nr:hypothetical protein [Yersinia rohdei]EEQ01025.1 hypothetical protein yrohd0001_39160 [Yersinia rohdei ATCC 43380]
MSELQANLAFRQGLTYSSINVTTLNKCQYINEMPGNRVLSHRNDGKPAMKLLPFAAQK